MGASSKRRFRFGLRGLLASVAVCALGVFAYSWLPNYVTTAELSQLRRGMTQEEVREILGAPDKIKRYPDGNERWDYGIMSVVVLIDKDGTYVEWQDW